MKRVLRFIAAAVGGALAAGLPWWALNDMRVGDLGRDPWPQSNGLLCAAIGAVFGALIVFLYEQRRRRRTSRLASIATQLGLQFHEHVVQSDLDGFKALRVIREWWAGRNRLSGVIDGTPVEMLDYTYLFILRGNSTAVRSTQTMVLLTTDPSIPTFDLRSRILGLRLLDPDRHGRARFV